MSGQYKLKVASLQKPDEKSEQDARALQSLRVGIAFPAMITFQITGHLTEFTGGDAEFKIDAQPPTVRDALRELWNHHGGLRDRVLTEQGEVRQHVNIFVNSSVVRRDEVLDMSLDGTADICIMPAVSGG